MVCVCVYVRTLAKSRKESQIKLFFSLTSYFYFIFISKGAIVYREGSRGGGSSLFLLFFFFFLVC